MAENTEKSLRIYKRQLKAGYIQHAYYSLIKYLTELKYTFNEDYKTGNISPGYMDYSYFPFYNDYLREHKLRFGIVLNHEKMRFELWLMGQNNDVKKEYWNILKKTKWIKNKKEIHKYAIAALVLEKNIDFNDIDTMNENILGFAVSYAKEIQHFLESTDC